MIVKQERLPLPPAEKVKKPVKIKPLPMLKPKKPQGQKDEQGRYGFSKGGAANMVAKAMEVQKPN